MPTRFVDRVEHLGELRALMADVAAGRGGRALVVDSVSGMGKSELLRAFEAEVAADAATDVGVGGVAPRSVPVHRVVTVRCRRSIGADHSYGAIVDLLLRLADDQQAERPRRLRKLRRALRRGVTLAAPEVLSAVVPGLGALFRLGKEIAETSLASGSMPLDSLLPLPQAAAAMIADALLDLFRQGPPTVVLVDDVQYADPSSLLVLDRLLRKLPGEPLGLVLSHTTDGAYAEGPGAGVEELLRDWARESLLRRRVMEGLPPDAVAELVRFRCPRAPSALAGQLSRLTAGHAVFVTLCLEEWTRGSGERTHADGGEDDGEGKGHERAGSAGDGSGVWLPDSLERVVEDRLRLLTEQEHELLVIGATQGETFLSRTVADVKRASHDDVMETLRRIAQRHRLIMPVPEPAWARREASDCYRFEHEALRDVVYRRRQTPQQARTRHARIAAALMPGASGSHGTPGTSGLYGLLGPSGSAHGSSSLPDGPSLERRLEIAHHLRNGGPECLLASAEAHYGLAREAALHGLSFTEAERHCEEVIKAVRELPEHEGERDRWFVLAVELLLSLTEVRWTGRHRPAGGPDLDVDALAAEAEAVAARLSEPGSLIRTTLLRGKTLLATQGVVPSLEKLRGAVELAERYDDPVALFTARVEYGRQVSKRQLAEGLAQLREAERMYASDPRLGSAGDPVLQHTRDLGEMQLGITLYDSGHLGEALTRLSRCVERLRDEPLKAELPMALNYLAQVHIGLGGYEEAEAVLREALDFEADRGGDSGWHAYNGALLAHLLVSVNGGAGGDAGVGAGDRTRAALELMADAWAETERTWLANLVPIVRNLYAEMLLLLADGPGGRLDQADRLAVDTVVETRRSGMIRSEIAAHGLRGRILLRRGDAQSAQDEACEAVRLLDQVGDMPALRTEEVLYHAAVVRAAAGAGREARALLERARGEVARKAGLITDDAPRDRFLTRVPLNQAVREGRGIDA